ncbi:MAG: hypothetical protein Q4E63_00015 [Prevotellaceae bacterium]|nr:hypothetical protein [Prevotellaceae bacterium]
MKKLLTTLLLLCLMMTAAMAQGNCPYCNGTGKVVKNVMVSRYGAADYKVKCPTCGAITLKSTGHSHIHCSHCGGTGRRGNSSSNSYSSRNRDKVTYDPDSPEGMLARSIAYDIKYGLPYTDEEDAITKSLIKSDPTLAKNWIKYRNIMNDGTVYFNRNMALCSYRHDTVQSIDAVKNSHDQELAKIAPLLQLPSDLYAIFQQLYNKYQSAYTEYRNVTGQMQGMRNLQEQIDNYRLMRNMFY